MKVKRGPKRSKKRKTDQNSLSLSLCMYSEERPCKSGRELSPETDFAGPLSRTCSLQNCEKMNFCCLGHPACGVLLQQLELILWDSLEHLRSEIT